MRCEIIAIGTELLLGQHVDTNSTWIGEQLALAGIDSHFQTKVGDNLGRIAYALRLALGRSDAVITCGGLGPTQDDITREAIAEVMNVSMSQDPAVVALIEERFRARNRTMPSNNLRQADVPHGAAPIPQMPGTAPGLICPVGEGVIYAVPGVPSEMREMLLGSVLPDLRRRSGDVGVILSRTLRTWGRSESALAELVADRITQLDRKGNPTLAFLASGIEGLKVRITAKAADEATARRLLDEEDEHLRALLGDLVFGVDGNTMETVVLKALVRAKMTLGVVETISGGLVTARLTGTPVARGVLRGGLVCNDESSLLELLDTNATPPVSEAAAKRLAEIARREFNADVGLAATGVSDAEAHHTHAPGTVFLGVSLPGGTQTAEVRLPGDLERIRQFSVISLLNLLRLRLEGDNDKST